MPVYVGARRTLLSRRAVIAAGIPLPRGFVAKGDSLTEGLYGDAAQDYPSDLARATGVPLVANYAQSGTTVDQANTDYDTQGGSGVYNALTADTYLFMMGTNDTGGVDATTIIGRIQTHINKAVLTGYRVALGTIPKRGDNPTAQAILDTVNAYLRANWRAMGATWLMDFDQWPTLQNPSDATYYRAADNLHFTDAGYLELAKCAQAALGLASLSTRGASGAPRFRPQPPDWDPAEAIPGTFDFASMQQVTVLNGSIAALVIPLTGKCAFAIKLVSGVANFVGVGVAVAGADTTGNPGFGSSNGGAALYNNGLIFAAGGGTGSAFTSADGDTVWVLVDVTAKKIWFTKDGTTFYGVDGTAATASDVAAGNNSGGAQSWNGTVYGIVGGFGGSLATVAQSVMVPGALPSGFSQL